jgi:hypothetical protein
LHSAAVYQAVQVSDTTTDCAKTFLAFKTHYKSI